MDNPIILVAIGFFFGAVGLMFGFLLGSLRRRNKDSQTTPEPAPPPPVAARNTPKDSVEILSVWRNERTGKLLALLETKPLSPSHVTDEQKDKLAQILTGLRTTIVGEPTPPPAPVAPVRLVNPAPIQPEPALVPLPVQNESTSALSEVQKDEPPRSPVEPPLAPVEIAPPPQAEKVYFVDTLPEPISLRQALSSNPFKINVPSSSQKPTNAPKSIVEQIDEIFQTKLVTSPFADQDIQLKEAPHGMTILIGSYKYEGIDAVPDPAIRALIKESAREWNEKVSRKRG